MSFDLECTASMNKNTKSSYSRTKALLVTTFWTFLKPLFLFKFVFRSGLLCSLATEMISDNLLTPGYKIRSSDCNM